MNAPPGSSKASPHFRPDIDMAASRESGDEK